MVRESADRERVLLPAEDWSEYLKNRRLSYSGEVLSRAETLTWAQVEPALPPPGLGGKVSALALASGRMRDLLMKPELTVLPREEWPDRLPRAQVRAESGEWAKITAGLVSEGWLRAVLPLSAARAWRATPPKCETQMPSVIRSADSQHKKVCLRVSLLGY